MMELDGSIEVNSQKSREEWILLLDLILDKLKKNEFKGIVAITMELEGTDKKGRGCFQTNYGVFRLPFGCKKLHYHILCIIDILTKLSLKNIQEN